VYKMDSKKKNFKRYLLSASISLTIVFLILYGVFWSTIEYALSNVQDIWLSVIASVIRIIILAIMSIILFNKWFKQEAIFTSDAYFLFALFFMVLTVGKVYDLFYNLILISDLFDEIVLLFLVKIRFLIITINILPVLYIGLQATMTLGSVYIKELTKEQFNKIRLWIVILFLLLISIIIIIAPEITFLIRVLPYLTFAIFIALAIMFLFMYKNKHLSQANGLIIGIAFFAFIGSNIFRSIVSVSAMNEPSLLFAIEGLDIIVNAMMFIGFIRKPKYAR
jgi:hypothetical protein